LGVTRQSKEKNEKDCDGKKVSPHVVLLQQRIDSEDRLALG
jgi:hypothetical protein